MTGDNTLIHSHGINRRDFMKLCAALALSLDQILIPCAIRSLAAR
ncbi:twin-arginine translocation signal domain-containing protein, partial [Escherichia coli]|nr:twin-arginine translocation signal domain-containing protein [Escherichia coli]